MSRSTTRLSTPTPVVVFPCGSMSTTSTRRPSRARDAPRLTAVVDFPTPPFWLTIAITRAVVCSVTTNEAELTSGRVEMLVDVAFSTRGEKARLVPRRVVGDLLEQRVEHLSHPPVAAKSAGRKAFSLEHRHDVVAGDRQVADGERRAFREHGRDPRFEPLVRVVAPREAGPVDVSTAQREEAAEMLRADPAHEAPKRLVRGVGVGGVHVVQHEVRDRRHGVVGQAQPRPHRRNYLGADLLVLVERVATPVGPPRRGPRLA